MKRNPTRRDNRRSFFVEQLEPRMLLAGDILAKVAGGSLVLSGDPQDNSAMIFQNANGRVRVVGQNETTINGQPFVDFPALNNDLEVSLIQGGSDQLIVYGKLNVPNDFSTVMKNGALIIDGSRGRVSIGGDLSVSGGASADVSILNDVRIQGKAEVKAGGNISMAAGLAKRVPFDTTKFSNSLTINNPYFPLVPGTQYTYLGSEVDSNTGRTIVEKVVVDVLDQTRTISGVQARVVHDQVWKNDIKIEDTIDWYAQDDSGNVWYLGEIATNFEYDSQGNLVGTNNEGSWETGVSGAQPGIQMPATPHIGDRYYQEFRPRVAIDQGDVLSISETASNAVGNFTGVLKTRDWTVLHSDALEHKLYAPGLGQLQIDDLDFHTGEINLSKHLISVTLNGVPVTRVVDPATFTGSSKIGASIGFFARVGESIRIHNAQSVFLTGARFVGDVSVKSVGEFGVRDSYFASQLFSRTATVASLHSVACNGPVDLAGNIDVHVSHSTFGDELEMELGASDNIVSITNSQLNELQIDGLGGHNHLQLDTRTTIGEMDLKRITRA